ncbi:hypothetical protein F0L68_21215 [Solihabitans fulvus]|uniref:Uncharacterized protein n=1 Tax=Solihabitans fulvus TaxID=1892852 RepID=A0A5B2X880_9PSEU|nr:hypothetical protein [Solihabitans fulvus]KAA2259460.1 hypothetical protein F0L68_21215 [Solihabitans fulvus]
MSDERARLRWPRRLVTALLLAETLTLTFPALLGVFADPPPFAPRPTILDWQRQGVLIATSTVLLVVAAAAMAVLWLRPRSASWLVTYAAAHAATLGLAWAHGMPILALVAGVSLLSVSASMLWCRYRCSLT